MRLTDRLLAAVYRGFRDAENREWKRRYHVGMESVPLIVNRPRSWHAQEYIEVFAVRGWEPEPPRPPASQDPNVHIKRPSELLVSVPVPHDGRPHPFGRQG